MQIIQMPDLQYNIGAGNAKASRQKRKHNQGAAMIVVVCVMAVVMILSLTLMMAAYQMLATVGDEGRDDHYYQQAVSFSEIIRTRLENKDQAVPAGTALKDELTAHIYDFMKDDAKDKEILEADPPANGGAYGGITIVLDKTITKGYIVITVSVDEDDKVMASCKAKYEAKEVSGSYKYKFCEYY